ncbi:hypothetical protein RND81_06G202900 [Saponaria officinalis]|uniref:Uncharacterized protein n=1 Tax=Saponaria officinalis TaxID=3572 RepID=A0AAW1K8K5_SAPOF
MYSSFKCLAPGGRLAVISFHSLEDRMTFMCYQHSRAVTLEQEFSHVAWNTETEELDTAGKSDASTFHSSRCHNKLPSMPSHCVRGGSDPSGSPMNQIGG